MRAIKTQLLDPEVIELMVGKVNAILESQVEATSSKRAELSKQLAAVNREIENLVGYVASTGDTSPSIQRKLRENESRLAKLNIQLEPTSDRESTKKARIESGYIAKWFSRLEEMIESDPLGARHEMGTLIGQLTAHPAEQNGRKGLELRGKPNVEGI